MRRKRSLQSRLSSGFVWRLTDLRIGPRLRVAFACVFLIMISGGAVTVWEFRTIRDRVRKVSLAEQRVTAVVQVNNSLMMLMSRLHRAAETYQRKEFEIDAWRLLTTFRSQTAGTVAELRQIAPQSGRQELVVDSLNDMLDSLPERVRSLIELARADDWVALRARLTDQVDHTDEVEEQLMEEASAELSEARNHLFENIEAAERRVAQTLAVTTLLSLIAAGVLGIIVTQSITRPLATLDGGALAVARGDFSHEVPVTGTDELAQVAEAFNRMTRELADLYVREREARRTAEHLNETLQHANDNLSVFAYSASHDLQEPLRNITLTSQLLQRKCSGQLNLEGKELTEHLVEESRRMSDLIRDLLAYMEVSSDRHGPIAATPAEAAMRVALTNLGTAIASEHASVTYGDLPEIQVEPIHLQQLFQNLIGNAIKYRSDKPPSIQISASEQDGWWHFSVRDNGIGVAPQYHEHIFKPFRRLHSQSERPGTGIGLAICQKIVERYGGRIWIDSAPGKGSDFRFTLPRTL